jgi:hypothetical protein
MLSLFLFSKLDKLVLQGAMFMLYLYCLTKAFAKSFHLRILVFSSLMYQLNIASLKLSWEKCISNFLSCTTSIIFLQ